MDRALASFMSRKEPSGPDGDVVTRSGTAIDTGVRVSSPSVVVAEDLAIRGRKVATRGGHERVGLVGENCVKR